MSLDPNPAPASLTNRGYVLPPYGDPGVTDKSTSIGVMVYIDSFGTPSPAYPYINPVYPRVGAGVVGVPGGDFAIGDVTGAAANTTPNGAVDIVDGSNIAAVVNVTGF